MIVYTNLSLKAYEYTGEVWKFALQMLFMRAYIYLS